MSSYAACRMLTSMTVSLVLLDLCSQTSVSTVPTDEIFEFLLRSLLSGATHSPDYFCSDRMAAPPPVSPSEGQRQLLDNFLNHPRIARDPGKGMQRLFSHTISHLLHLSHVDLWLCCLFRLHIERRCSEVPPNSRGVSLVSALSILLFLGNQA